MQRKVSSHPFLFWSTIDVPFPKTRTSSGMTRSVSTSLRGIVLSNRPPRLSHTSNAFFSTFTYRQDQPYHVRAGGDETRNKGVDAPVIVLGQGGQRSTRESCSEVVAAGTHTEKTLELKNLERFEAQFPRAICIQKMGAIASQATAHAAA